MKFKIMDMKTRIVGAWCNDIKTANNIKNDLYRVDKRLYNKSNRYIILLNDEEV